MEMKKMIQKEKNASQHINNDSYVANKITETLLDLLKKYDLNKISISVLCERAGVGRASFYRNFNSKEDVLKKYDQKLIELWGKDYENNSSSTPETLVPSLVSHYKKNKVFYSILYRENLSYIVLDTILYACKLQEKKSNIEAYTTACIGYGLFGIINEWIARGMTETEDELLKIIQKK